MKLLSIALISMISFGFYTSSFAQDVKVSGDVENPFTITAQSFESFKTITVKVTNIDGAMHEYSGIRLLDIITQAKAVPGNQLRGKSLAKYLLVSAADGYQVVLALAEFDPAFNDREVILANKIDGAPLPPNLGPYRLIVPGDKKPARSAMRVTGIEVLNARKQ